MSLLSKALFRTPFNELEDPVDVKEVGEKEELPCDPSLHPISSDHLNRIDALLRGEPKVVRVKEKPRWGINGTVGPAPGFKWSEVNCKDGTKIPKAKKQNAVRTATALNNLRQEVADYYGISVNHVLIKVSSWFRSTKHNRKIGGVSNSLHLQGTAADINILIKRPNKSLKLVPVSRVRKLAEKRPKFRRGGIGAYSNFTHLDTRPSRARWSGP